MSHEEFARQSARMFLENMVAESFLARDVGMVVTPAQVVDSTLAKVMKIAERDLPLARLMDSSDMLIHAEGPGAIHGMPWLKAVTWLLEMANDNIRRLAVAAIDLWGGDGKAVARHLDLRIPGMVPGSVWVGIKLMPPAADLLPVDAELVERLGANLAVLPELTRFIGDEGMCSGYEEVVPDPAIRDAHLGAEVPADRGDATELLRRDVAEPGPRERRDGAVAHELGKARRDREGEGGGDPGHRDHRAIARRRATKRTELASRLAPSSAASRPIVEVTPADVASATAARLRPRGTSDRAAAVCQCRRRPDRPRRRKVRRRWAEVLATDEMASAATVAAGAARGP